MNPIHLLGTSIYKLRGNLDLAGHHLTIEDDEDRLYASATSAGLSVVAGMDGTINTVQLHAPGHEDHHGWAGPLPAGIEFTDDRTALRRRLGIPTKSGEPTTIHPFGLMPAWDRYDEPDVSIHVEFAEQGPGVRLVSLMTDPP